MGDPTHTPYAAVIAEVAHDLGSMDSSVLSPAECRAETAKGYAIIAIGFACASLHMWLGPAVADRLGVTRVSLWWINNLLAWGLTWAGGRRAFRYPAVRTVRGGKIRRYVYGPYSTKDVLAGAYYAHICAKRARNASGRARLRAVRLCRLYLQCPLPVALAADVLEPPQKQAGEERPPSNNALYVWCIYTGGNRLATAWAGIETFVESTVHASTTPTESIAEIERLTGLWCGAVYKFYQYERGRDRNQLDGLAEILIEIAEAVRRELASRPTQPAMPKTTILATYREWVAASGFIVVFWVCAVVAGLRSPTTLPACLMSALVGSGAVVFAAWNLYASRKRAEAAPVGMPLANESETTANFPNPQLPIVGIDATSEADSTAASGPHKTNG